MGLSFFKDGKPVHNEARPFIEDLDSVPYPNFHLIDGWDKLLMNPFNYLVYFTQVSRGCTFPCNFCSVIKAFGQHFRSRSIDNVIDELHMAFVPVHIDIHAQMVPSGLGYIGTPTFHFLNAEGKKIDRIDGGANVADFTAKMREVKAAARN